MEIIEITKNEYTQLLNNSKMTVPVYGDIEAIECYEKCEIIKVVKNNLPVAVFLMPIDDNGIRREYRYFPYLMPILLKKESVLRQKEIYKVIFNYIFKKYNYTFIPLHPNFKIISAIASEGGLVEMRHTHVIKNKLTFESINSKLRNHIRNAIDKVTLVIDNSYKNFDFYQAIKGKESEVIKRSELAKKLLNNNKAFIIKAKYNNKIVAGMLVVFDKEWAYLLHSYQKEKIRGVIPYMIMEATKEAFDKYKVKNFDLEGSVIEEIDNFFSSFDANIMSYPYIIQSKNQKKLYELIDRSMHIEGRIKEWKQ